MSEIRMIMLECDDCEGRASGVTTSGPHQKIGLDELTVGAYAQLRCHGMDVIVQVTSIDGDEVIGTVTSIEGELEDIHRTETVKFNKKKVCGWHS